MKHTARPYIKLNLQLLSDRRQIRAGRFTTKCANRERFKDLFPLNPNQPGVRNIDEYAVKFAHTDRLKDSSILAMQRLLNKSSKQSLIKLNGCVTQNIHLCCGTM
jgi:hypothetical protein